MLNMEKLLSTWAPDKQCEGDSPTNLRYRFWNFMWLRNTSQGSEQLHFLCLSWLPYSYIQLSLNISMALSHRCLKPLQTLLDLLGILIFLDDLYRPFGVVMDYFLSLLLISNLNNNVSVLPALLFTYPALPFLASSQARINVTAQQLFFLFPILLPSNSFFKFITY